MTTTVKGLANTIRAWFAICDADTPLARALLCEQFRRLTTQAPILYGVLVLDSSDSVRQLRVTKFRGSNYHAGWHLMRLTDEGMIVSPTAA